MAQQPACISTTPIPMDPGSSFGREYPMLFDLKRIEVLRGPQGVLYGEGTEGGTVRFITVPPALSSRSGFANGEVAATSRSAANYEVGAASGGAGEFGCCRVRLGGWLRHDGGFVDWVNPYSGAMVDENANWTRSEAGNAAVTIVSNESLQITPSSRYQATNINDTSAFFLSLSDPAHGVLRNGSGLAQYYSDRFSLASLKIAATFGFADLSSATAYIRRDASALEDNATLDGLNQPGYEAAKGNPVSLHQTVLSEELRLASPDRAGRLRWIVGASYVHARYEENQDIATSALADGGALAGRQQVDRLRSQLGAYGELDLRLRQRLRGSVGVRVERDSYDSLQKVEPFPPVVGEQDFSIIGTSLPVTPRFNLSPRQTRAVCIMRPSQRAIGWAVQTIPSAWLAR